MHESFCSTEKSSVSYITGRRDRKIGSKGERIQYFYTVYKSRIRKAAGWGLKCAPRQLVGTARLFYSAVAGRGVPRGDQNHQRSPIHIKEAGDS